MSISLAEKLGVLDIKCQHYNCHDPAEFIFMDRQFKKFGKAFYCWIHIGEHLHFCYNENLHENYKTLKEITLKEIPKQKRKQERKEKEKEKEKEMNFNISL